MMAHMSVLVMATATVVVAAMMVAEVVAAVVVVVVAVVDTHDDSVDTVEWFRVCFENV
jgi:hypothetical protein